MRPWPRQNSKFQSSSPTEELYWEVCNYICIIFCVFYLPRIPQDTWLHSWDILKCNKGSFKGLWWSLSLSDCDSMRQLCPDRHTAQAETLHNCFLLRNSRWGGKSKTFPTTIKAERCVQQSSALTDGETERVQSTAFACQSLMGAGTFVTRSILVRTVQILRFSVQQPTSPNAGRWCIPG